MQNADDFVPWEVQWPRRTSYSNSAGHGHPIPKGWMNIAWKIQGTGELQKNTCNPKVPGPGISFSKRCQKQFRKEDWDCFGESIMWKRKVWGVHSTLLISCWSHFGNLTPLKPPSLLGDTVWIFKKQVPFNLQATNSLPKTMTAAYPTRLPLLLLMEDILHHLGWC